MIHEGSRGKLLLAVVLCACGGGAQQATTTTSAPTATATTTTDASTQQCSAFANRIDALNAEIAKVDTKTPDGLQAFSTLAQAASTDIAALHVDGTLMTLAQDSATYLKDTSQKLAQLSTILGKITVAVASVNTDTVKTCVGTPAHAIGQACKGKTSDDCQTVLAAIDTWGKASKSEAAAALARVRAVAVTDPTLKARWAEIVKCVAPLSQALDEIARDKEQLAAVASGDKREQDLDARFKTACGRGLFNKP
jgi:hypothetical protein